MYLIDTVTLNSQREYTSEGYLKAPAFVARSGVQYYTAQELGLSDRDPLERIGVYRPEDEVFGSDSLATYSDADITNDHPREQVNSETYKKDSVGHVSGAGVRDGNFVKCNLVVKDAETIRLIKAGKVQLSAGYTSDNEAANGVSETGETYEFVQRNIRINHVAIVRAARAGHQARFFDGGPELVKIVFKDAGALTEAEEIQAKVNALQEGVDKLEAERDIIKGELEKLQESTSEDAIKARISEVATVTAGAKAVAGNSFVCDSLDVQEIKREALKAAKPETDWDAKTPAYVDAAFDIIKGQLVKKEPESHKALANDAAASFISNTKQQKSTFYSDAWKKSVGAE